MKNIVICCDGTGNEYGQNNTNVVHIYTLAVKNKQQIAFYDPGVGTGGWEYMEETGSLKAKTDQTTGGGIQKNIEDAYRILMNCYEENDKVYLFGFSRGAFTVRSLAGMLHKCGLLRPANGNLVEYSSKIYNTKKNDKIAAGFKAAFCRPCSIYFIGVWDTVESLVLNAGKKFHNAQLNREVKFGYHALAIDEKRKDFPPCLWDEANKTRGQTIEQVWFAGAHSDVGGWYKERGLSNIALRWMLDKASACGMTIDNHRAAGYRGNPHDKLHDSYSGFWIFRGKHVRKIKNGAKIHKSVVERLQKQRPPYKPDNLPDKYKVVS